MHWQRFVSNSQNANAVVIWQRLHRMHYTHCTRRSVQIQPFQRYEGSKKSKESHVTLPWPYMTYFCIVLVRPEPSISTQKFKYQSISNFNLEICCESTISKIFPNFPSPRCGGSGPPCNTMFLGPPWVFTPNKILIRSAVFAQWSRVKPRDRQTGGRTGTANIGSNSLHYLVQTNNVTDKFTLEIMSTGLHRGLIAPSSAVRITSRQSVANFNTWILDHGNTVLEKVPVCTLQSLWLAAQKVAVRLLILTAALLAAAVG